MLGAYTTFVVQSLFRSYAPAALDYALLAAVPTAFLFVGVVGVMIERGIIRFLYGRPLETLLATWGLSLVLQQTVRSIFGPTNQQVTSPTWMSGAIETTSGLVLTYNHLSWRHIWVARDAGYQGETSSHLLVCQSNQIQGFLRKRSIVRIVHE